MLRWILTKFSSVSRAARGHLRADWRHQRQRPQFSHTELYQNEAKNPAGVVVSYPSSRTWNYNSWINYMGARAAPNQGARDISRSAPAAPTPRSEPLATGAAPLRLQTHMEEEHCQILPQWSLVSMERPQSFHKPHLGTTRNRRQTPTSQMRPSSSSPLKTLVAVYCRPLTLDPTMAENGILFSKMRGRNCSVCTSRDLRLHWQPDPTASHRRS